MVPVLTAGKMMRIVAVITILALTLISQIEAHGHDHRHHEYETTISSVSHHDHEDTQGCDHHSNSHDHSDVDTHSHSEECSVPEKHALGHSHQNHEIHSSSVYHEHGQEEDHDSQSYAHHHPFTTGKLFPVEKHPHGHTGNHAYRQGETLAPTLTLWLWALASSLLVSLASLISLILLPVIFSQGKPSRTLVDGLAAFGAGSMLGDALLHQLPHAFGASGGHSHAPNGHHEDDSGHTHAHSLQDLSVGLAVLGGILLFFLVEKIVRRAEELSVAQGRHLGHSHHHRRPRNDDEKVTEADKPAKGETFVGKTEKAFYSSGGIRKRNVAVANEFEDTGASSVSAMGKKGEKDALGKVAVEGRGASRVDRYGDEEAGGKAVLGYLNLFSDGVHNFTDGMALGSAFLLHGTVGGWSRTLFLLAHELPQEVGDFGILLRSGFGVFEALAFNFLSALVALFGTTLALLLGGNPGNSAMIEGFTAGGFIYIAVGAVMPDMHSQGSSLKTTLFQVAALSLGMGVAIAISLAE